MYQPILLSDTAKLQLPEPVATSIGTPVLNTAIQVVESAYGLFTGIWECSQAAGAGK